MQRRVPRETKESISLTLAAWIEGEGIEEALNDKRDLLDLGAGLGTGTRKSSEQKGCNRARPFLSRLQRSELSSIDQNLLPSAEKMERV